MVTIIVDKNLKTLIEADDRAFDRDRTFLVTIGKERSYEVNEDRIYEIR